MFHLDECMKLKYCRSEFCFYATSKRCFVDEEFQTDRLDLVLGSFIPTYSG